MAAPNPDDKKIIFSMVGVSKIYPPQKQVLKNIYLSFFYGAKIGIIGLNGSGKSSLLKIIAGIDKDIQGDVVFSPGYSVGYLEQEPRLTPGKTVIEIVREGVQPVIDLLKEFDDVNAAFADPDVLENPDKMDALIQRQGELQDALDCMKKDGTMAKFYEKWFNKKPAADDLAVVITPGYGVPGMPGYDPTPHELKCGG